MLELCASRQKPPSDHRVSVCWGCASKQHASSQLAPPRATRSAPVAWALCAPGACGEPDLRLALRARRTALRAEGALGARRCAPVCRAAPGGAAAGCHRRLALCARRRWRGRCAPGRLRCASRQKPPSVSVCWLRQHASSQLAPPRATRSAPMAWALRARAPAAAFSPPRATRSAPKAWALRARAPTCCPPPDNCARCLLVVATSKTSCASRCSRRSVQGALRAPAEGEGGEGDLRHHHARACGGTLACYRSMCYVSRRGAPLQPERPTPRPGRPPHFERARAAARRWRGAS